MAGQKFDNSDYIEVHERIAAFKAAHPEGSLQSRITHLTDALVVVKAWAFRTTDDARPGVGHSSLIIPGSTPFTRGSEIENAETSAWGRAIAALGFEVKRGIATKQEVENKRQPVKAVEDLGTCPEHNEPYVKSTKTGVIGHAVSGGDPCIKQEAA